MLILDRQNVSDLLDYPSCIAAVEDALRSLALGSVPSPVVCGMPVPGGGFHVKAAVMGDPPRYFVAKTNANFPGNPQRHGRPTIQGVVLLFDARNGTVLAALDSGEVTVRRTAAATAVAAKYLARPNSASVTLVGCGVQGRAHLRALREVLPITTVFAHDAERSAAETLAAELAEPLRLAIEVVDDLHRASRQSDVVVTCTSAHAPILQADDVRPGAFIAGVGADHPEKCELAPGLLAGAAVVVDSVSQCVAMGDLRHAIAEGCMTADEVHAELGDVIAGRRPGRRRPDEVFVFDSTGTALQDVAAAALVYERSRGSEPGSAYDTP